MLMPIAAGGAAIGVIAGAKFVPREVLAGLSFVAVPLQLTYFAAAVTALIVAILVLFVGDR
jgi:hypothetical protein